MSVKNPLTPAGIEPATFRFVAQRLNNCATAVPSSGWYIYRKAYRKVIRSVRTVRVLGYFTKTANARSIFISPNPPLNSERLRSCQGHRLGKNGFLCSVKCFNCGTDGAASNRGADKSLARPRRKQAAPVKTVMGRGMD